MSVYDDGDDTPKLKSWVFVGLIKKLMGAIPILNSGRKVRKKGLGTDKGGH